MKTLTLTLLKSTPNYDKYFGQDNDAIVTVYLKKIDTPPKEVYIKLDIDTFTE